MRVYLHIGAPKTGTTFLQKVLDGNRDEMKNEGVLYPQLNPPGMAHHTAVWDLRGEYDGQHFDGRWDQILEQAARWDGKAVLLSSEMFVYLDPDQTRRALTSFGDDVEVHVVYTARDLSRQLPAVWQERIKNRRSLTYDKFRRDALGRRRTPMAQHFWRAQDVAGALERWSVDLPPERVHVVTAPPPGSPPNLLWERFASVVGLDPSRYDSEIPPSNESLSVSAVEVLRRYNQRYVGDMSIIGYRSQVQHVLMPPLTEGVQDRRRLPLDFAERKKLVALSESMVQKLAEAGYDVVGSLDDLVPAPPSPQAKKLKEPGPDDLSDAEVVDALLDVLHHLLGSPT